MIRLHFGTRIRWHRLAVATAMTLCLAACGDRPQIDCEPQRQGGVLPRLTQAQTTGLHVARVIIVGDSISAGIGAQRPQWSYAQLLHQNDTETYPNDAGRDLRTLFGDALAFVSVAHPGDTTDDVLNKQLPRLLAADRCDPVGLGAAPLRGHSIVVMTIGGNDIRHQLGARGDVGGIGLRRATENLRRIFATFHDPQRFPDGVSIYFGNVYDVTDGTNSAYQCIEGLRFAGLSQALQHWDLGYRRVAEQARGAGVQVCLVDLLHTFYGHGFHFSNPYNPHYQGQDPSLWIADNDCIHPNNRGHHELRRVFYRAIAAAHEPL